jgi:hypothetical protein
MTAEISYAAIAAELDLKTFAGEGGNSASDIYPAVGMVCGLFEDLQDEIIRLFEQLCGGPADQPGSMSRIISVTLSFRNKLELTTEATKVFLEKEPDKRDAVLRWLKLCEKASTIRNKIAHGWPAQVHYMQNDQPCRGAFLGSGNYDPKAIGRATTETIPCWNLSQLQRYSSAILQLRAMIQTVREELAGTGDEPWPHVLDPAAL